MKAVRASHLDRAERLAAELASTLDPFTGPAQVDRQHLFTLAAMLHFLLEQELERQELER